jgi:transcriptional regulator with XRE-family HTH domain
MQNRKKSKNKTIYTPKYEEIITRLRKARKSAGLKQDHVAEELGKYASYLSKIEHGDRRLDVIELLELAEMYGKDVKWILGLEDKE